MLRLLLMLLLLANAGFYAWTQDWLAPLLPALAEQREPERLAAQVRPELISVLSAKAASAAVAAAVNEPDPLICLEAGPFSEAAVVAAKSALAGNSVPDGAVLREPRWQTFTWGVVMGRFADRETLRSKADELKKLGIRYDELTLPPSLVPGLRLGNFSDRYGAETALNSLTRKGVRSARVVPLPTGTAQWWLRVARADAEMQTRLKSLPPERLGSGFRPCAVVKGAVAG